MPPPVVAWPGLGSWVPALDEAGILSPPPSLATATFARGGIPLNGPATSSHHTLPFFFFFIVLSQFVLI